MSSRILDLDGVGWDWATLTTLAATEAQATTMLDIRLRLLPCRNAKIQLSSNRLPNRPGQPYRSTRGQHPGIPLQCVTGRLELESVNRAVTNSANAAKHLMLPIPERR